MSPFTKPNQKKKAFQKIHLLTCNLSHAYRKHAEAVLIFHSFRVEMQNRNEKKENPVIFEHINHKVYRNILIIYNIAYM